MKKFYFTLVFLFIAISYVTASPSQIRQAIQSTYRSPDFIRMDYLHPISLHWPKTQKVRQQDFKRSSNIKKFSTADDRATVVTEFRHSVIGTNPKTGKKTRYESIDVYQDLWLKREAIAHYENTLRNREAMWAIKSAKLLTSDYRVNGKSQSFKMPAKRVKRSG